ncbi:MAG: hypothetical protein ACOCXH_00380 [Cyclobacteriaceae bacterium]
MKKIIILTLTSIIFFSCDPLVQMEANIVNLTSKSLFIEFVSWDASYSKTLQINPSQKVLFDIYDGYGTYAEPELSYYDSVIIKNQAEEILKVYKRNDFGKNIYNIDDYWISSEPSKRFFIFEYEIESEDID